MDLFNNGLPLLLIKVQKKQEYLSDFLNGKLYMNSSGYFRNDENNFRSDLNDGRYVIPTQNLIYVIEDPNTGERLFLDKKHGINVESSSFGFKDDDKIPIFCMTLIDSEALIKKEDNKYLIKKTILNEISKFGPYCVIIPFDSLINRIYEFNKKNDNALICKPVEYYNEINHTWKINEFISSVNNDPIGCYSSLFKKTENYKDQHELRIILVGPNSFTQTGENHRIVNIRKFDNDKIFLTKDLYTMKFEFIPKEQVDKI